MHSAQSEMSRKFYYFILTLVNFGKFLAYHLKDSYVPLLVRVPQFGNHWIRYCESWKRVSSMQYLLHSNETLGKCFLSF